MWCICFDVYGELKTVTDASKLPYAILMAVFSGGMFFLKGGVCNFRPMQFLSSSVNIMDISSQSANCLSCV